MTSAVVIGNWEVRKHPSGTITIEDMKRELYTFITSDGSVLYRFLDALLDD